MPWLLFLFAGVASAMFCRSRRIGLAFAAGCLTLSAAFWPGRFFAEKMLTDLVMPLGLLWLGLLAAAAWFFGRGRRGPAAGFLVAAGALSTAGQGEFADLLVRPLEADYRAIDPFAQQPFDAVCVLGGGLSVGPGMRIMTNASGDRVVLGARLYHAGVARRLVCTGKSPSIDPSTPSESESAAAVWRQLGVPDEAVVRIPGENTRAEMAELKKLVGERGWPQVGLVTSAWHMRRAERLAAAAGLDLVPLPADFRSAPDLTVEPWLRVRISSVIPTADAVSRTHLAIKERIAGLVGR